MLCALEGISKFMVLLKTRHSGRNSMENQERLTTSIIDKLMSSAADVQLQWKNPSGTNTRHFVLDELLDQETCTKIYHAFPRDGNGFFNRESFREKKRTSANLSDYDPVLADITYALQDQRVVESVAALVGFRGLEPDPKLYAGGLSMMFQGDFLNPHIDNSHDSERQRYRRLNLLYYVSPAWKLEHGGNFELWDEDRTNPKTIISATNRLVVMETNKTSWHSVSPVKSDAPRCCVSNYYFSKTSPDGSEYFHVTSFTGRPEESAKRAVGAIDNAMRNAVAKVLKVGRGKDRVNKDK
jgi:Rps23 Pro-64 3,4-dihydroxylase Tpa1-like proline 4-hydroxylase